MMVADKFPNGLIGPIGLIGLRIIRTIRIDRIDGIDGIDEIIPIERSVTHLSHQAKRPHLFQPLPPSISEIKFVVRRG